MSAEGKLDVDFVLTDGVWDLAIDTDGDLVGSNSIDTAILMSLFTDKRATASEIQEGGQRRGWFGNAFNDDVTYEVGSKLWIHSNQGRMNNALLNDLNDKALDCLQWMLEDNVVSDIQVDSEILDTQEVQLNLKFVINENIIERNFILWENSQWR
ncbi:phage GP46 family protein [Candidatus Pacearchaeota archaeon]|nr:phage GP46 family protein [Candidatus Pacearchaeota archaeon]